MERLVKSDVVVIPFPFTDLSSSRKRPALIMATLQGDDLILCQITSEKRKDNYSIPLNNKNFKKGKLNVPSVIRPNRLFTADKSIINYKLGRLNKEKSFEVQKKIIEIFSC